MDGYIGTIMMCGFNFAPMNFAFCNGATMQINQMQALYSLLGTIYGGNGTTNFNLPNLAGRVPVAFSPQHPIGAQWGCESQALTQAMMPAHNHIATINASENQGDVNKPTNAYFAKGYNPAASQVVANYTSSKAVTMASDAVSVTSVGSGAAVPMAQPSLAINFVICLQGLYPSRE